MCMCMYVYIYIYIHMYMYIYIYSLSRAIVMAFPPVATKRSRKYFCQKGSKPAFVCCGEVDLRFETLLMGCGLGCLVSRPLAARFQSRNY